MRLRTVLGLGAAGFLVAVLVGGKTHTSTIPLYYHGPGVQWRLVNVGRGQRCLPVAVTAASQARGLAGIRHVSEPLVLGVRTDQPAAVVSHGDQVRLTGVWVALDGRVLGHWRIRPRRVSRRSSGAAVSLAVLYGPGSRLPRVGTRIALTGLPCNMGPGL